MFILQVFVIFVANFCRLFLSCVFVREYSFTQIFIGCLTVNAGVKTCNLACKERANACTLFRTEPYKNLLMSTLQIKSNVHAARCRGKSRLVEPIFV